MKAVCLLLSGAAHAATWKKMGAAAGVEYYVDKASARKVDKLHKVWTMHSFAQEQSTAEGKPYRSVKALHLYSCAERTTVLQSEVFYAEPMGRGAPLQNLKYEKFGAEDIVPDSPAESALKAVCGGKK